ncbi:helix-turn-helix domain-containing protein [Emcibacter sp. SYSU 3D8]|uniref:winged helix-turn-helix transcriptional regulator n=1 Tax=Emcibacter sp. SYSU 3D8 TaxID=3133969 RepID=UPI0031FF31EB
MASFSTALTVLAGKWKLEILWHLSLGTKRFSQLRRALPRITQHMLTARLRELEADGMIHRKVYAEVPPKVEYTLSRAAVDLAPMFAAALEWAYKYSDSLKTDRQG